MQTVAANSAGSIISFTNQNKEQKNSTEKSYLISLVPKVLLLCSDEKVNCCPHETILSNSSLVLRLSPHATTKRYASYGVHVVGPLFL